MSLNGGLLGLEGILQRFFGAGRLLFLLKPRFNPEAATQFGPYAYRGNAAEYFNLLWPVSLSFWWMLHRSNRSHSGKHHVLLVCATIMSACPIISTSRGGALVAVGLLAATSLLLMVNLLRRQPPALDRKPVPQSGAGCQPGVSPTAHPPTLINPAGFVREPAQPSGSRRYSTARQRRDLRSAVLVLAFVVGALGLGFSLGWQALKPRLAQMHEDFAFRRQIYEKAQPMAADYPWFGTGPGTFENLFQFYRIETDTVWPAQLHNDWLETRITFGRIGSGLLALGMMTVFLRSFSGDGISPSLGVSRFIWLALAGVLIHARFDFPFQVHSIVSLFVLLCAVLFVTSRPLRIAFYGSVISKPWPDAASRAAPMAYGSLKDPPGATIPRPTPETRLPNPHTDSPAPAPG